jgi:hypothetical protein
MMLPGAARAARMRTVLVLALGLVAFTLVSVAPASARLPDVWPPVQLCTDGIGVFAQPCPGWLCENVGGELGTTTCIPLAS